MQLFEMLREDSMEIGPVMAEGSIAIILILANETIRRSAMTCFHRAHGILRIFLFICKCNCTYKNNILRDLCISLLGAPESRGEAALVNMT